MSSARPSELGALADPDALPIEIEVASFEQNVLLRFLQDMLTIRLAEESVAGLIERGLVGAPCHLGIGQEAVAVGVSASLTSKDRVFGGHRSHSHYLAMGGDVYRLLAEVLGKEDGASRGMGGSMHLYGKEIGFYGSVPLVGATIPLAVGAAIAARLEGAEAIGVAYFGDGATEEGVFHESMNLAAAQCYPVLFVCENNLFSSHLDINLRQPSDRIGRFGEAHRMNTRTVDGNDVVAVANAARQLVEGARQGCGPGLLEAVTYRHRGHVGAKEDIDVGVRRKLEDVQKWKERDPIDRLAKALINAKWLTQIELERIYEVTRDQIHDAAQRAERAAYPAQSALLDCVYAGSR